ncbi:MAG: orotate phosphoribosyltransferase [Nitrososphaerales archaeon]
MTTMTNGEAIDKALAAVFVESEALTFGSFKLSGGRTSPYYLDLRVIPSFPNAFRMVIGAYSSATNRVHGTIDLIGGVPTSGLIFAAALAYSMEKPLIYVREKRKTYGKTREIEGVLKPGAKVILVDDLVTSGASIISAAKAIREEGGIVSDCIVLIDREEGARRNLLRNKIQMHAISSVTALATQLYEDGRLDRDKKDDILNQTREAEA